MRKLRFVVCLPSDLLARLRVERLRQAKEGRFFSLSGLVCDCLEESLDRRNTPHATHDTSPTA